MPLYNKKNSLELKKAATIGLEMLFKYALDNNQDLLMDGTFSNYRNSYSNIDRSLSKNREVAVYYLYQDPKVAWEFTKKREKLEGRPIPKKYFVESFFEAKNNVNRVKAYYKSNIELTLVIKDFEQGVDKLYLNIDNVDNYLKIKYTPQDLERILI